MILRGTRRGDQELEVGGSLMGLRALSVELAYDDVVALLQLGDEPSLYEYLMRMECVLYVPSKEEGT